MPNLQNTNSNDNEKILNCIILKVNTGEQQDMEQIEFGSTAKLEHGFVHNMWE